MALGEGGRVRTVSIMPDIVLPKRAAESATTRGEMAVEGACRGPAVNHGAEGGSPDTWGHLPLEPAECAECSAGPAFRE